MAALREPDRRRCGMPSLLTRLLGSQGFILNWIDSLGITGRRFQSTINSKPLMYYSVQKLNYFKEPWTQSLRQLIPDNWSQTIFPGQLIPVEYIAHRSCGSARRMQLGLKLCMGALQTELQHQVSWTNRANSADENLSVINMLQTSAFVRKVILTNINSPCVILNDNEQIENIKSWFY